MCAVGAVGLCFMPAHAITWTLLSVWFRRNNDTGVDVHWSAGKFCASGGGTRDGTIRHFAGSLWAAADGKYTMLTVTGPYHCWVLQYFHY